MFRKLANVEITVRGWREAVDWYTANLGLSVAYEEPENEWCVLSFDEGKSGLVLRGIGDLDTDLENRVVPQIQTDDLDETLNSLKQLGVKTSDASQATRNDGRTYRWFKVHDPENNLLRIYEGTV